MTAEKKKLFGVEVAPDVWRLYPNIEQALAFEAAPGGIDIYEFTPNFLGNYSLRIQKKETFKVVPKEDP